ncbi:Regulator of nonsense transcripts UPF2 [Zancudomyces culisetae]|uniref:Regulator of nonsense transcripts UPF2 n=1 Tax=Zancudomyces culisetae TaxID=1213189 RepID=A0A1R1PRY2_ZANCU|nr:Regulator of nonsense transcripts UPF2 [Zancudomyces culisetae]|eukprot:OMH83714.1 Regulator of nonsense transcripts UPF2 [Zancudomyces culisetae]
MYERWAKQAEKMESNIGMLSETIGKEFRTTTEEEKDGISGSAMGINFDTGGFGDKEMLATGWWVDEEERQFYVNLLDLRSQVPPAYLEGLLGGKKKRNDEFLKKEVLTKDENYIEEDVESKDGEIDAADYEEFMKKQSALVLEAKSTQSKGEDSVMGEDEAQMEIQREKERDDHVSGATIRLDTLLARLPQLVNRERTDETAVEYCLVNSKTGQKRVYSNTSAILSVYWRSGGRGTVKRV